MVGNGQGRKAVNPMNAIIYLLVTLINIYQFIMIAMVIMSWLISFNVINTHNRFVAVLWDALVRLTEPVLAPIRRLLPDLGGLDISPIIALLALYFLKVLLLKDIAPALGVY
jgi:YggT family protein